MTFQMRRFRLSKSRFVTVIAVVATVLSLMQGLSLTASSITSRAYASAATGTGGEFVPVQGQLIDTRASNGGGGPLSPNVWKPFQVDGAAGVPTSGVGAVQVQMTVYTAGQAAGNAYLSADLSPAKPQVTVSYDASDYAISNAAIVPVNSTGKIEVDASSSVDVRIDVEGYFTAGDNPAAGGYVPGSPTRIANSQTGNGISTGKSQLTNGTTATIQVSGLAGVPSDASAVFANISVINESGSAGGYVTPYAADQPRPTASTYALDYLASTTTTLGTTIPLSSTGAIKLFVSASSGPVDVFVDVDGYFDGSAVTGAFTPATAKIASALSITSGSTATVGVAGVAGIPAAGSGIAAVALEMQVATSTSDAGRLTIWASTDTQPNTRSFSFPESTTATSGFTSSKIGSDGKIKIYNSGPATATISLTVEGWYTNTQSPIPTGQNQTEQLVDLQASSNGGTWVTYRYRVGSIGDFHNVPVTDVVDGNGSQPSAWAVGSTNGTFARYTWDVRKTVTSVSASPNALVQVAACYGASQTDTNYACGMPANIDLEQSGFGDGDALAPAGPGDLALETGDFDVHATDGLVAGGLGGLGLTRSLTTLNPVDAGVTTANQRTDASGVFGPGWTAAASSLTTGHADLSISSAASSGYINFSNTDGSVETFQRASDSTYVPVDGTASSGTVVTQPDASHITMTDSDGAVTTWTNVSGVWQAAVQRLGATTNYTYDNLGRVSEIVSASANGANCAAAPDTTVGCRGLHLYYSNITVSGTTVSRLQEVDSSLPQVTGSTNLTPVARYEYNSAGLLSGEYDPQISPRLETTYTYNSDKRLSSMTTPGMNPWSFTYDSNGRLTSVSRAGTGGSTEQTTFVYNVMGNGSTAPTLVSATQAAQWDETSDLPTAATAEFPPSHIPSGTTASSIGSSDWPYATIDYFDVNGAQVNTAQYGSGAWQIDTAQYDQDGNDVWDLTAANRAQALTPTADTDSYVAGLTSNVTRAALLASTTAFNPLQPDQVTDTYGPTHPVQLANGTSVDARTHVSTTYDEGAPFNDENPQTQSAYDLPTTVVTAPYDVQVGADDGYPDAQTTRFGYGPVTSGDAQDMGWSIGEATSKTIQMAAAPSSADLVSFVRYNAAGQPIEVRLPGDNAGSTPRTTDIQYYNSSSSGACGNAASAGLICTTSPAAQPTSGAALATTSYTYDQYGNTLTQTETYGGGVSRTTTSTYDNAERLVGKSIVVTPSSAGGTVLPSVAFSYNTSNGLPSSSQTGSGSTAVTLLTAYDALGRISSYTDSTGSTTTRSYDVDDRPVAITNPKGTTSFTYDSGTEHRGLITAESLGAASEPSQISATYDANGDLASETYPNGLTETKHYDNTGLSTQVAYSKSGATWLTSTVARDSQSRIVSEVGGQAAETMNYDQDGRLASVGDAYQGTCTTRVYGYDADSNRTSLKSYPSASGGTCTTSSSPTVQLDSFDSADRLTNLGYAYDSLGRTTTVPSADAVGIGARNSTTGTLSLSYYANDFVASQSQGSGSMSFTLDPNQERVNTFTDGASTTTNHYGDGTDAPSWIESGSTWTRNLVGPDGLLIGTEDQAGTVTLDLTDLQGSVIAQVADDPAATTPLSTKQATEFGAPRTASTAYPTYGWLGGLQRSSNLYGGLMLMGERLYSPAIGRFLSPDPVAGGNANAYVYPNDPVNNNDTTGRKTHNANGHDCGWTHCDFRMSDKNATHLANLMNEAAGASAMGAAIAAAVGAGAIVGEMIAAILAFISGALWFIASRIQDLVDTYHNGIFFRVYYWGEVYVKQQ